MAHSVTLRTCELGLRIALGAQRSDVLLLVLRQRPCSQVCGVLSGLAAALVLTRLAGGLLFHTEPVDLATFGTVTAVLIAAGLAASYIPAHRATRSVFAGRSRHVEC